MATTEKPVLSKYKDRMDKAVAALKEEFASLRTGRASASLLDQIHVDAYGSTMSINQVASVSVPEPRMITVSVWDRGLVVSVEKAIRSADLGLNPVVDGQMVVTPSHPVVQTVPQQAGEASTMVGGNPNADPMNPIYRR